MSFILIHPNFISEWRKKLGNDTFNEFSNVLVTICHGEKMIPSSKKEEEEIMNRGKLKLDATVADQNNSAHAPLSCIINNNRIF